MCLGSVWSSRASRGLKATVEVHGRPASRAVVAVPERADLSVQQLELRGREAAGEVVKLEWVVSEVVELALPVVVLDVEELVGADCVVGPRVSARGLLKVGVDAAQVRAVVLDEDRVAPSAGVSPRSSGKRLWPSLGRSVLPIAANVLARSMFSAIASVLVPAGTPGPTTTSGTWMSVSNAVSLPGVRRYSPVCRPLSELNTR